METKHKIYGRVKVLGDLYDDSSFVKVKLLNPRPNLPAEITVGKAELADQGSYVPKKRPTTIAEKYMPLAYAGAAKSYQPGDDFDELLSVAVLALCDVASRHDNDRNNSFAAFAKPRIAGALLNHKNPERNGTMNIVGDADLFMEYIGQGGDSERELMISNVYAAFDELTPKQKFVMEGLYIHGHTLEALADRLGTTNQAVDLVRDRAAVAIRKHLGLE